MTHQRLHHAIESVMEELQMLKALPMDLNRVKSALKASEYLTLELRRLYEMMWYASPVTKKVQANVARYAGRICITEYGWIHVELDNLLPHCQYESSEYLHDTLLRLLRECAERHELPRYKKTMLIIEERSDITARKVFDNDNKGWKVIPNALKGLVIDDDDQYSLEIALLSSRSDISVCHIFVLDATEADVFFSWRCGNYGIYP